MTTSNPTVPNSSRRSRSPRPLAIIGATALILVGSYAVAALRPTTVPPAPTVPSAAAPAAGVPVTGPDAATIDAGETPVGSIPQIDHSIAAWTKNLAANPKDYLSATNLAILYQGRGRLSYDLADYERALAASREALRTDSTYAPARAAEAAILFSLHDYAGAFKSADSLLRDDPSQLGALVTRSDAETELGMIPEARADLDRLTAIGEPAVLIRKARLASVTGDRSGAVTHAKEARKAALEADSSDIAFYAYAVGEYARLAGDPKTSRSAYRDALDARPNDLAALVGLARIDAFDGDLRTAITGLQRATAIAPQPEPMALLGDLQQSAGEAAATKTFETVRFIEQLGDIQSTTFDRQLLRFELDHGGASDALLARAKSSLATRPDWTGHDTVAWTLYRLGRFDQAVAEIGAARGLGADDARLRFHEGAIALARGDRSVGMTLLRSALDLGPALDPIERAEATTLLGS